MSSIHNFDEKIQKWIKENRIKWCFYLFGLGVVLGIGFSYLTNSPPQTYFRMSLLFGLIFPSVEMIAGGSGVSNLE